MAIDMSKMKSKLRAMNRTSSSSSFWKPTDGGQHKVRILCTPDGDPFKEYFFHYRIGKQMSFLCPKKNFGDDCPVCNLVSELYNEGDESSVALAKKYSAKQRFFSPVMVRGEEKEGVRLWGYGKQAYQSMLQLIFNPEYGDITDLEEGTDLNIVYGTEPGAMYPSTKITPSRKASRVCADLDPEECKQLLNEIPDFDAIFEKVSTEDVEKILNEALHSENSAQNFSPEVKKYSSGGGQNTDQAAASKTSEIDAVFNSLQ